MSIVFVVFINFRYALRQWFEFKTFDVSIKFRGVDLLSVLAVWFGIVVFYFQFPVAARQYGGSRDFLHGHIDVRGNVER